jgi:DNA-binding MarR family transcriptional regulator
MNRFYDDALAPAELRTTQYSILARLHADGPATVGGLAERLGMDRTTLSREVEPLVRDGLVDAQPGEDRRRRMLSLSEHGRERLNVARPLWERAQRDIRSRFGGERTDALLAELRELVAA